MTYTNEQLGIAITALAPLGVWSLIGNELANLVWISGNRPTDTAILAKAKELFG